MALMIPGAPRDARNGAVHFDGNVGSGGNGVSVSQGGTSGDNVGGGYYSTHDITGYGTNGIGGPGAVGSTGVLNNGLHAGPGDTAGSSAGSDWTRSMDPQAGRDALFATLSDPEAAANIGKTVGGLGIGDNSLSGWGQWAAGKLMNALSPPGFSVGSQFDGANWNPVGQFSPIGAISGTLGKINPVAGLVSGMGLSALNGDMSGKSLGGTIGGLLGGALGGVAPAGVAGAVTGGLGRMVGSSFGAQAGNTVAPGHIPSPVGGLLAGGSFGGGLTGGQSAGMQGHGAYYPRGLFA